MTVELLTNRELLLLVSPKLFLRAAHRNETILSSGYVLDTESRVARTVRTHMAVARKKWRESAGLL